MLEKGLETLREAMGGVRRQAMGRCLGCQNAGRLVVPLGSRKVN